MSKNVGIQQRQNPNQNYPAGAQGQGGQGGSGQDPRYAANPEGQHPGQGGQPQVVHQGGMHQPIGGQHGGGATVVPTGYAAATQGNNDGQTD